MALLTIVLGTLVSEDLTCISTGLLIQQGMMNPFLGLLACFLGIFVGDLGLWLLGRAAGLGLQRWTWLTNRIGIHRLNQWGEVLDRHCGKAVISSRFLPGARLPMYLAAGMWGRRPLHFVMWSFIASVLWTPLFIGLVMLAGPGFIEGFQRITGPGWPALFAAALGLLVLARIAVSMFTAIGRATWIARVSRLWRWEFWPVWLFYLPISPYIIYLSLKHRGFSTLTSANPGIPHGGVVGESKFEILSRLPRECVIPNALIDRDASPAVRTDRLSQLMRDRNWQYPIVLKPDAGQRGAGVKLVRSKIEANDYFLHNPMPALAQQHHAGPFEAGIFYYRTPGDSHGRIFSITDKKFPVLVGDGHSTLEHLIWKHPRFRMQAGTFLKRHRLILDRVLGDGERFQLAMAGNHCQGTMFCDGSHLITQELTETIDQISQSFDGFYFGRFDIRYSDVTAFMAGRHFAVVELNGATSESTNIYDPTRSLWWAYGTLLRQWRILFDIGAANRERGQAPTTLMTLLRLIRSHYRDRHVELLAD